MSKHNGQPSYISRCKPSTSRTMTASTRTTPEAPDYPDATAVRRAHDTSFLATTGRHLLPRHADAEQSGRVRQADRQAPGNGHSQHFVPLRSATTFPTTLPVSLSARWTIMRPTASPWLPRPFSACSPSPFPHASLPTVHHWHGRSASRFLLRSLRGFLRVCPGCNSPVTT